MSAGRFTDHIDTSRTVKETRRQLGRDREGPELGLSR
jgi:hypothetical protein